MVRLLHLRLAMTEGESKRGEASLKKHFPLSFEGEGDKGGEVAKDTLLTTALTRPPGPE